jgi:hypothetical protein
LREAKKGVTNQKDQLMKDILLHKLSCNQGVRSLFRSLRSLKQTKWM